jgi:hypothetical protein
VSSKIYNLNNDYRYDPDGKGTYLVPSPTAPPSQALSSTFFWVEAAAEAGEVYVDSDAKVLSVTTQVCAIVHERHSTRD